MSYDLKGNKVECSLKSNGNTRTFVWHSHKDKGEDTQGICVTFPQGKVGLFHSEKEANLAVHTKQGWCMK